MAKTVDRPLYDEFKDTPYITQSRDLQNQAYGYTTNLLDNFNSFINPEQYQAVADAYTQAQWNDLNRNYQQAVNQNAARERNRLGTYGASSSLYNTNTMQNYYNDLASRVAAQTASQYNNLINNEYNRRLKTLSTNYDLWNNTGNINYTHDKNNWQIRNENKDRQWANDVDAKNNNFWNTFARMNKGAVEGFSEGMKTGNIWGGIAGAVAGTIGNSGTVQDSSNMGYNSSDMGGAIAGIVNSIGNRNNNSAYSNYINNQNWLANTGIGNIGLNTSNLSDTIRNAKFSWQ